MYAKYNDMCLMSYIWKLGLVLLDNSPKNNFD